MGISGAQSTIHSFSCRSRSRSRSLSLSLQFLSPPRPHTELMLDVAYCIPVER